MKKRLLSMLLSLAMVVTMIPTTAFAETESSSVDAGIAAQADETDLGINVALDATAAASYTNPWYISTTAMNDGELAGSDSSTSWNNWSCSEWPANVSLTWDAETQLNGMRVIWWADNATLTATGNVTFPKSCQVEYLDADGNWQQITGMVNELGTTTDEVGVVADTSSNNGINGNNKYWNYVSFPETIKTTSLRLVIERNGSGTNGIGISEWEVFGVSSINTGDNIALLATAAADYANTDTAAANVNDGALATDNTTTWNTWKEDGTLEYPVPVTLDWGEDTYEVSSLRVMWWADNADTAGSDGVTFPKSATLQYYNARSEQWVDITDLVDEAGETTTSVGVKYGSETEASDSAADYLEGNNRYWNGVILKTPVKTSQLRLVVDRNGSGANGIGIGEIEVFGKKIVEGIATGDNIAPAAKATAASANTPVDNVNNGSLASGASTSWNTWNSAESYPLSVTLTWEKAYEITSSRVMWWADNGTLTASGNVTFPKSCDIEYYDHGTDSWVKITDMIDESSNTVSSVGVKYGSADAAATDASSYLNGSNRYWNGVLFSEPIKTTKLRLTIDRNGSGSNGVGIGEWEVYGEEMTAEWGELIAAKITGPETVMKGDAATYYAESLPEGVADLTYEWSVAEESAEIMEIVGSTTGESVEVQTYTGGKGILQLTISHEEDGQTVTRSAEMEVKVDGIESIDTYVTATAAGKAPILPKMVVANGLTFDDSTPSLMSTNNNYDFGEDFNSKLIPVTWEEVDPALYAAGTEGTTFTVNGTVDFNGEIFDAVAEITVNPVLVAPVANSTVTFENVQLTDEFWLPKQEVNAVNSLNKGIYQIEQASGGEPNFENAIKKLNGESYDDFQGYVFQDSDIYKSIEAISYTLSVINDDTDADIVAQREKLEEKLAYWISMIEQVQYADGYINTHFTLRSATTAGGSAQGTHRWRAFANHEMYNLGHFYEAAVAYTRYREGIGDPDYSLYVVAKRSADQIVALFGPGGTRHEVPGHEEIELAMVKLAKLVEEYEGEGTGQKYLDTVQLLIDRRGESSSLRESGYWAGEYSQDNVPIKEATEAVGHAVRACYFYAGVTDIATLLPEGDEDREAYLATMDTIWDSVALTKTYITGGIGVSTHGEDFGDPYELPNNLSYCETCAAIALANWNQRMNLVHEDAKYADVVERTLYNAILVGTNLEGNLFYYSSRLEVSNGNGRSDWFACACCPPNLMRTIAKLSEYMYTVHADDVFVNMYIGSDGNINVEGTNVNLVQETQYPWDGAVQMTVTPDQDKEFTMKIRIPGWTQEQENKEVAITVNGEAVTGEAVNGYVSITRTWTAGDVIMIDMPMEIRMTEADPNVTTNADKIALERGPIVYCMEKAGNAQINDDTSFNPLNFVIPRDAQLTATYNESLLNGVVEINGTVLYNNGGTLEEAQLQAVPYYAWNNRGDDGVQGQNSSSKMLIWTDASGTAAAIEAEKDEIVVGEALTLTGVAATETSVTDTTYAWAVKEGDSVEITSGADTAVATVTGVKAGSTTLVLTVTNSVGTATAEYTVTVVEEAEKVLPFVDVNEGDWYYEAVYNNYFADLMIGKTETTFEPASELTRAQLALIIYRMEGEPAATYDGAFEDVEDGVWFTDAVAWAAANGIITGYADGTFGPHDIANREQAAVILYRYAAYKGYDTTATADLSAFTDGASVSVYAEDAMKWAVGSGIILGKGTGTELVPQGEILRCECAAMIDRFAN